MNYVENANNVYDSFLIDIEKVDSSEKLLAIKYKYLGKNGIFTKILRDIKNNSIEDRKCIGKEINDLKEKFNYNIALKDSIFKKNYISYKDEIDITLPGIGIKIGKSHVISKNINLIECYFEKLGFCIIRGNELDNNYYNFDALNMPYTHPSRSINDTFYINDDILLRTHTSNMQIHIMQEYAPPFKFISSGKVYRKDSDFTHTPMFHQIEGFLVNKNVSISNLKFTLVNFLNFFFNKNLSFNIRSSYFPFTEPSMEIDILCVNCNSNGCVLCKGTGWIEVLGCGMIHPNVLKTCNINTKVYNGFAFGVGIERLAMIKYKIDDLRLFYENNFEFLQQF